MKPVTVFGCTFSPENAFILSTLQRSRGYRNNIWVSSFLAHRLRLTRVSEYNFLHFPVTLTASNKECSFENIEAFKESKDEIEKRAQKTYPKVFLAFNDPNKVDKENLKEDEIKKTKDSLNCYKPLDTNGERFDSETENRIALRFHEVLKKSPFWVTEFESKFVYQLEISDDAKRNAPQFQVRRFGGHLLTYYHVSATSKMSIFTSETCRRYAPYNFWGFPYRPVIALAMKRYAVENQCCSWERWTSLQRAQLYDVDVLPHVIPLSLVLPEGVLQLINVGLTTNPYILVNAGVKKQVFCSIHDEMFRGR